MYFNFTIRLLELEGVSSKQTYLGVVEQLITENDHYQQEARENCGCVIMKVIVMKLEITLLRCEDIVTVIGCLENDLGFINHRNTPQVCT